VYEKYEKYTVHQIEPHIFEVSGEWKDDIHDLKTRILINIYTFKITAAEASGGGVPFEICHQGIGRIGDIIGANIGPGFSRIVRSKIMGPEGCTHLGELILGTVKAFIQAASRSMPDKKHEALYAARWDEWMSNYSDQCVYFSQADVSRAEIENAIIKGRQRS